MLFRSHDAQKIVGLPERVPLFISNIDMARRGKRDADSTVVYFAQQSASRDEATVLRRAEALTGLRATSLQCKQAARWFAVDGIGG